MAIVLLYSFLIVSTGRDSVSAGRDIPFQFDKSQNLSFSIVFGFKTIIFNKFTLNYHFLINFYHFIFDFYRKIQDFFCDSINWRYNAYP